MIKSLKKREKAKMCQEVQRCEYDNIASVLAAEIIQYSFDDDRLSTGYNEYNVPDSCCSFTFSDRCPTRDVDYLVLGM